MEQAIAIENLDALKKRIFNTGFGDRFDKAIDEALAAGITDIRLSTSEVIENKRMYLDPEIKVKENKGYYNGFKATLHNEDGTITEQWFKASDRIMMNEAYILMMDQQHPRAILKTYYDEVGEKYNQWIQLDFTQKTDSGNFLTKRYNDFDQLAKLNDYDFEGLSSTKQKLTAISYMTEGREIELTPVNQEHHQLVYMRANPERNTFTFLSTERKPLYHDQFRTEEARQRIQQEKNTRQSGVSFAKNTTTDTATGVDTPSQETSDSLKKKNRNESDSMNPGKRPRVVQKDENNKGKSL